MKVRAAIITAITVLLPLASLSVATPASAAPTAPTPSPASAPAKKFSSPTPLASSSRAQAPKAVPPSFLSHLHGMFPRVVPPSTSTTLGLQRALTLDQPYTTTTKPKSALSTPQSPGMGSFLNGLVSMFMPLPSTNAGIIQGTYTTSTLPATPNMVNTIELCSPVCGMNATTDVTEQVQPDGSFSIPVPAGMYQALFSSDTAPAQLYYVPSPDYTDPGSYTIASQSVNKISVSPGQTTPISAVATSPVSPHTISGSISLTNTTASPLTPDTSNQYSTDIIGIDACPVDPFTGLAGCNYAYGYHLTDSANPNSFMPDMAPDPVALATPDGHGHYSYSLSLPEGQYHISAFYINASSSSIPTVKALHPITDLTSDVSQNYSLSLDQMTGSISLTGLPQGSSAEPVVLECSSPTPTIDSCQNYDFSNNTDTSADTVLLPGSSTYSLPYMDASYIVGGYLQGGSLYLDQTSVQPLNQLSPPSLAVAYKTPAMSGTFDTSAAQPTADTVAIACPLSTYDTGGCLFSPYGATLDASGSYSIYAPSDQNQVYYVYPMTETTKSPGIYGAYSSPGTFVTTSSSTQTTSATVLPSPTSWITGSVTTPYSANMANYIFYCQGPLVPNPAPGQSPCQKNQTLHELFVASSYAIPVSPGTWHVFLGSPNSDRLDPIAASSVTVGPNQTAVANLNGVEPRTYLYGTLLINKLSAANGGLYAKIMVCPASVQFSMSCKNGLLAPDNESFFYASPNQIAGFYAILVKPGSYNVAPILDEPRHSTIGQVTSVTVAGHKTRLDLAATDDHTSVRGRLYYTSTQAYTTIAQVIACPSASPLVESCPGGVTTPLSLTNYYSISLRPGSYRIEAKFTALDASVSYSPAQTIAITPDSRLYRDLTEPAPTALLTGIATVPSSDPMGDYDINVLACPASETFSPDCQGALTASNWILRTENNYGQADSSGNVFDITGPMSPSSTQLPFAIPATSGSWNIAAGVTDPTTGSVLWSVPTPVSILPDTSTNLALATPAQ